MSEYRLAPRAERDLDQIAAYIAINNPSTALRVIDAFETTFRLLSRHQLAGRSEDELFPGLRVFRDYARPSGM